MNDTRDLIVVDVETTGLDVESHWVLEVAAVNVRTGEELYFVPALPEGALDNADGRALKINRYFERDVYAHRLDVQQSEKYWGQLWDWLSGNTLGGSNPTFDAAMLTRAALWSISCVNRAVHREPTPWHHRLADLSAYAAGVIGIEPTALPGLNVVCRSLHVENESEHSALGDARATAECFRKLAATATERKLAAATEVVTA